MAVKFKDTININDAYTFPLDVGTTGQYIKLTDAATGETAWSDLAGITEVDTISYEVRNETGSSIPIGSVVYINGGSGSSDHVTIALSNATTEATSSKTFGITAETIANNSTGKVILEGLIEGVNTSAFSPGQTLWLSTTSGQFTYPPPATPNHAVFVGYAVRCQQNNGTIFVKIQNGYELGEIHDIKLTAVAEGDLIVYDANNGYWINSKESVTAAQLPAGASGDRPTPAAGMIRFNTASTEFEGYDGTNWRPIPWTQETDIEVDSFTGDGTTVNYTLTTTIAEVDNLQVYIDGVYQAKGNYSISGTTLTFSTAPPIGTAIEVVHLISIFGEAGVGASAIDGNGTANYIPKFSDSNTLANSVILENATNIGIGITPTEKLHVNGTTFSTTSSKSPVFYDSDDTTYYGNFSSTGDSIRTAGDIVAFYSSDIRLKDNIIRIDNALEKVESIGGYTFEWNEISHKETGLKDIGVIAQEIESVLPELVIDRASGYKAVNYEKITPLLIEAIKELSAEVKKLKKQINK